MPAATQQLAWLAEAVVEAVLAIAWGELEAAHGVVPGARFAVLGYGSLGGEELGFGSDLDLVFLTTPPTAWPRMARGRWRASRWFARLGQAGIAARHRDRRQPPVRRGRAPAPDGAKGLLVSSLASFVDYHARARGPGNTGAGARPQDRRRCPALAARSTLRAEVLSRHAIPPLRPTCHDAPAHARRTRPFGARPRRCRGVRHQAGPGRPGRPQFLLQALVLRRLARIRDCWARATPALLAACARGAAGCRHHHRPRRRACRLARCGPALHPGPASAAGAGGCRDRRRTRGDRHGGACFGIGLRRLSAGLSALRVAR